MDLDEYRKNSYASWEKMSSGWHRWREYMWDATRNIREWMLGALDPQPGQTVLDLAAGIGDTGFAAASKLGHEGHLISTDFSPKMVEAARKRAEELEVENAEFRVLDAEKMDLDDSSVDGVICRFGYMLMADPAAALAETKRVLRPGGRVAFAVWATPDKNPFASVPARIMVERGDVPPPEPDAPGIFSLADHSRINELVKGAGFGDPRIEEVPITFSYEDLDQYWQMINELAGPIAAVIEQLSDDDRNAVRDEVGKRIERFRKNGGYELRNMPIGVAAESR
jgi:SAM-dependent methyltransferase